MKELTYFILTAGLCTIAFILGGWVPLSLVCVAIAAVLGL